MTKRRCWPRKILHFLVQPELRYWTCEAFNGFYMGTHGHFALYNVANMNIPWAVKGVKGCEVRARCTEEDSASVISGTSLPLEHGCLDRGGYAFIDYDKFPSAKNTKMIGEGTYHYFGITKLSLSFTYFFPERL